MRFKTALTILIFIIALINGSPASAISGYDIMKEWESRHSRKSEYIQLNMSLFDRKNREKKRVMHLWFYKDQNKRDKTLMKFSSPTNIRNTGLLTWEQTRAGENDQWLYLSASKRVKRIIGSNKKSLFMGTDLAYEDFRAENLNVHRYKILRKENLNKMMCWVIEAIPSTSEEKKHSGYSKRHLWIYIDNYMNVKSEFFGRSGKLTKIAIYSDLQHIKDHLWVSNKTEMKRLRSKTKTIILKTKRQIDKPINQKLVTKQGLRRPTTLK